MSSKLVKEDYSASDNFKVKGVQQGAVFGNQIRNFIAVPIGLELNNIRRNQYAIVFAGKFEEGKGGPEGNFKTEGNIFHSVFFSGVFQYHKGTEHIMNIQTF